MIDLSDLAAIERALYGDPSTPRRGRPRSGSRSTTRQRRYAAQRARTMAEMYLEGDTSLEEIGSVFGLTRERVRQILTRLGITAQTVKETRKQIQQRKQQESNKYSLERLLERCRNATVCKVCGGWNLRGSRYITCSHECAQIWTIARYQLDPETHQTQRERSARWVLTHSTDLKARESASRVLNNPPNRRYFYKDSKSHQAVLEVERIRNERSQ